MKNIIPFFLLRSKRNILSKCFLHISSQRLFLHKFSQQSFSIFLFEISSQMIFLWFFFLHSFSKGSFSTNFLKSLSQGFLILRILSLMSLFVMKMALFLQNIVYLFNWREVFPLKKFSRLFLKYFSECFFLQSIKWVYLPWKN